MRRAWASALVLVAVCCQLHAEPVKEIVVRFSDNSRFPIVIRDSPWVYLHEDTKSPAQIVRDLEPAALDGDSKSAYAIFAVIDICKRTTAADVTHFEACKTLTEADYDSAERWLKMSADAGFVFALCEMARRTQHGEDDEQALVINQRLWEAGDVNALDSLVRLTNTRDPILSAAYEMVYLQINTALSRNRARPTAAKQIASRVRGSLSARLNTLSTDDRQRVLTKAKELLATNAACCFLL